ncbi:VOC family protein [Ponticoccus alexandrii]|uniref:Glyoxalase/bleomycin resistance/extradiol dioxygenase family protein n=1 Tax=Ponticoccus alexandrii TaxID=1943633 RepID=A0ABX7FBK0_9RHOB|nr:VOC family protein [Ponticoccus alexandrii]ETA49725.1 bleomycin resistance protein [Rhodobacteraceae bacterium PD-2]QRF67496.1 glyoxalase/bleomycin resistance/extradiol dioxygenase family protein [Ponticoccus alexandrii]
MTAPALSGVLEAALYVDDLDKAEAFYTGLLGLERILRVDGRHVFFRAGETIVLCFIAEATQKPPAEGALPVPPHGASGPGHLCFASTTLDRLGDHLTAQGIPIEADFHWPHGPRSIYVRDPAGNSVEFAEPAIWAKP